MTLTKTRQPNQTLQRNRLNASILFANRNKQPNLTQNHNAPKLPLSRPTAHSLNIIRHTRNVKFIINKQRNIIRTTNVLHNMTLTHVETPNHLALTRRTQTLSLHPHRLKLPITTTAKPRNRLKPLNTNPNSSMIKLIPRSTNNSLTLTNTLTIHPSCSLHL